MTDDQAADEGSELEVLVVDDEERLADLFAAWLQTDWEVETAYDGEEALEAMADSVKVVLLDRRMPGLSGDEVLEAIREEGYDCRVVMVTAVDPDFDIIRMGFDDYLVKPVSRDELTETVDRIARRTTYQQELQEYYALAEKRALLEGEKSSRELEESDEYADLLARIEELEEGLDETQAEMESHDDYVEAFQDLDNQ